MFGLVLGTLNRAKNEDKARNSSDAAKKRQLIEQRLQDKLRKETDSVRRAEEAKKDKTSANRKEEELQLKDSIYKLRRARLSLLANFLSTSDVIPSEGDLSSTPPPSTNPLAPPPRTHPPPVYYLPAILLPSQEAFLKRRKVEVKEAAEKEWAAFHEERKAGIEEITQLRQRVVLEESRKKTEREVEQTSGTTIGADVKMNDDDEAGAEADGTPLQAKPKSGSGEAPSDRVPQPKDMEVDDEGGTDGSKTLESDSAKGSTSATVPPPSGGVIPTSSETKEDSGGLMQADEDDAVEY